MEVGWVMRGIPGPASAHRGEGIIVGHREQVRRCSGGEREGGCRQDGDPVGALP